MVSVHLVYVTTGSVDEARHLARTLLQERLAACANIVAAMQSLYWWDGRIQDGDEAVLLLKTRSSLVEELTSRIMALHSYDCPCVVAVPVAGGNAAYLDWVLAEASGAP